MVCQGNVHACLYIFISKYRLNGKCRVKCKINRVKCKINSMESIGLMHMFI